MWSFAWCLHLVLGASAVLAGFPAAHAQKPSPASPADSPTATLIQRFIAYTADGAINAQLGVEGNIASGNIAAICARSRVDPGRGDAFDCFRYVPISRSSPHWRPEFERVYRPCFLNPTNGSRVACVETPWSTTATIAGLRQLPLSAEADLPPEEAPPWAVELTDGERCVRQLIDPATAPDVLPATYGCGKDGVLLGEVDRSDPLWRISLLSGDGELVTVTAIAVAWY